MTLRVQICAAGLQRGGGIVVGDGLILTAAHIVRDYVEISALVAGQRGPLPATLVAINSVLDVALLRVDVTLEPERFCDAKVDDRWRVPAPPATGRPFLSGLYTEVNRDWRSAGGFDVLVDQLAVTEEIHDYHGYSGSPVILPGQENAVSGILLEQQPELDRGPGRIPRGANVLYALPIRAALTAFGIAATWRPRAQGRLPAGLWRHDRTIESLSGYRSSLTGNKLTFVSPRIDAPWSPESIWRSLEDPTHPGSALLTGFGGAGKTRTLLEVANIATKAGWEVFHVQGSDASFVAAFLAERLSVSGSASTLLVVDYLNLSPQLDLLSIAELANQNRVPYPRLSILASSRVGWERKHARDPGLDRLIRVSFSPSAEDTLKTCRAIVEQVAPSACASVGAARVLQLTGATRPILAVLLGQVVEDQFSVTRTLPAALVTEDLASWLETRLDEDELLPAPGSGDRELPHALTMAAAALAMSPAEEGVLSRTIAAAAADDTAVEVAQFTIERLLRLGWMVEIDGQVAPAHDLVVDKIVESTIFYDGTGAVRTSGVRALLSSVTVYPHSFGNVLTALERILDDRESGSRGAINLFDTVSGWIDDHQDPLVTNLSMDPDSAGTIATQLLRSSLWDAPIETRWRTVIGPVVSNLADHPAARDPLLFATRLLPKFTVPSIAGRALSWLGAGRGEFSDQLLSSVLKRKDLVPEEAEMAIRLALERVHDLDDTVGAEYLLSRVLLRSDVTEPQLSEASSEALKRVDLHCGLITVAPLVHALLGRRDLPRDVTEFVREKAWQWIELYPLSRNGYHVLEALLGSIAADQADHAGDASRLWNATTSWLSANGTFPEVIFLLQALVRWEGTVDHRELAVWVASEEWLKANGTSADAIFLIQAILGWSAVSADRADVVLDAAVRWLTANPKADGGDFLLQALVGWRYLSSERSEIVWPAIVGWLSNNTGSAGAGRLLQKLIGTKQHTTGERINDVWHAAVGWLARNPTEIATSFLIRDLLRWPHTVGDRITTVWDAAMVWLAANAKRLDAIYLLQALIGSRGPDSGRIDFAWDAVVIWLDETRESSHTVNLLRTLVASPNLSSERLDGVWSRISAFFQMHPTSRETCRLLQSLIDWTGLPPQRALTVWGGAMTWLGANSTEPDAMPLLQALARRKWTHDGATETIWEATTKWLAANLTDLGSLHIIVGLMEWEGLTTDRFLLLWGAATEWLQQNDYPIEAGLLLRDLTRWRSSDDEVVEAIWQSAAAWLLRFPTSLEAGYLLQALIAWEGTTDDKVDLLWEATTRWFEENGTTAEANHLLRSLVGWRKLSEERSRKSVELARVWCDAHSTTLEPATLLQAVLRRKHRDLASVEWTFDASIAWLEANQTRPDADHLIQALLAWRELTPQRAARLKEPVGHWLRANYRNRRATLTLKAIVKSQTPFPRSNLLVEATADWLHLYLGEPNAAIILSAFLTWPETTADQEARVFIATVKWVTANPTRSSSGHMIRALLLRSSAADGTAHQILKAAVQWLREWPDHAGAGYLVQALVAWPDLAKRQAAVSNATFGWLHAASTSSSAVVVLVALAKRPNLSAQEASAVLEIAPVWLEANPTSRTAEALVQALETWPTHQKEHLEQAQQLASDFRQKYRS